MCMEKHKKNVNKSINSGYLWMTQRNAYSCVFLLPAQRHNIINTHYKGKTTQNKEFKENKSHEK